MANRPVLHARDHEHGGADVVGIVWEDSSDTGEPGSGVNDAVIDATWTYLGGIFALDTIVADTLTNGTTDGFWDAQSTGTRMHCGLEGLWQIDIAGTVAHTSTTAPTIVRLNFGSSATDIFSVEMSDGDTEPLSYTTTISPALDDTVYLSVTHAIGSGTPSSTLTGTMVFTLIP